MQSFEFTLLWLTNISDIDRTGYAFTPVMKRPAAQHGGTHIERQRTGCVTISRTGVYYAFNANIGRTPASPAHGSRQRIHAGESRLRRQHLHAG